MTRRLLFLAFSLAFSLHLGLQAQCTPGNAISCPDPENNGQICPDTLPDGYVGIPYSVDVTILPPPIVSYGTATAPLNKLVILDVDNLPPGLSWVSNVANNTFLPNIYYCVLLSGTPTTVGTYNLKIKVGVYITFLGSPLYIGENIDSTSLSIEVTLSTGTTRAAISSTRDHKVLPNPVHQLATFSYHSVAGGDLQLDIFSLAGQRIFSTQASTEPGENAIQLNLDDLAPGLYLYRITTSEGMRSGRFSKVK